jgi:hypothetical protein
VIPLLTQIATEPHATRREANKEKKKWTENSEQNGQPAQEVQFVKRIETRFLDGYFFRCNALGRVASAKDFLLLASVLCLLLIKLSLDLSVGANCLLFYPDSLC